MARFVIKLGSAMASRDAVVSHVCAEVAARRAAGDDVVVVSSGAIARGLRVLDRPTRPTAIEELQAASAVGQGALYRRWHDELAAHGVDGAQVLLTSYDLSLRAHYLNARQTLLTLLTWGVVPVVNENDTTATEEISFGDNDFLAAQVAILVGADLLVVLTDTEGVFTADPRSDPRAALVPEVRDLAQLDALAIGHNTGPMGTGGMRSKVVAAEIASAGGIETVITTGLRPQALSGALSGAAEGTRFRAGATRYSSFKLWLKYARPSAGAVRVDAGRGAGPARRRHIAAAGRRDRRRRRLRRRRRGRRDARRRAGRQGDRQLQRRRAAPGGGPQVRGGARCPGTRRRRGRAPGLLRARVKSGPWPPCRPRPSTTSASRPSAPRARWPSWTPPPRTPRC